jgi:tRNA uridine 5-carboxymethylaminomethyl modification enzyme
MNAACYCQNKEPFMPRRDEAYIGVLIDDLITRGTQEPYRMFTSRAEYRLLLREDNADLRLTPVAKAYGLIDEHRYRAFSAKCTAIKTESDRLQSVLVKPGSPQAVALNEQLDAPLSREYRATELLRRPTLTYQQLTAIEGIGPGITNQQAAEQIEIQAKYAGYIQRQEEEISRLMRQETLRIPDDMNYAEIIGLSNEVRFKLSEAKPHTLGMATRIPGITPAAISLLLVHLKKRKTA